jgi:hypothetical protein
MLIYVFRIAAQKVQWQRLTGLRRMLTQVGAQQLWRDLALYIVLAETICHALQYTCTGIARLLRRMMLLQLRQAW